jgi:transcriptional regulator with XRE-family HTH domain
MTGYHTRWARPQEAADDPERIAIREALAFGKALYDIRTALGLTVAELATRSAMADDDIERIEEGGTEPTIPSCAASPPPSTQTSASPADTTSAPSGLKPTPPKLRRREHRHTAHTRRSRHYAHRPVHDAGRVVRAEPADLGNPQPSAYSR